MKDGGQAFPTQHTVADANDPAFKRGIKGMTLRDYFAGKAMQGMMANTTIVTSNAQKRAENAYTMADAMLKAREGCAK